MPLLVLGINHRTAPVTFREKMVFSPEQLPLAVAELAALPEVNGGIILSTCNRTEVYCNLDSSEQDTVERWLSEHHALSLDELKSYLYRHQNEDAVRHILRVASGLDSMILGEPQILGQLKSAYQDATRANATDTVLSRLFQHTFSVAKQIRTDTAIGASPVSVAFAAVDLAKQIFGDINEHTALLIGAGETIELAARHLHQQKIGRMIVANRTVERAHTLAAEFNGYAIALSDMPDHLAEADIIISSTASQLPILGKGAVEKAIKARKHRPVLMVDIAVPRDIEPEVGDLSDIYLYTVDDLTEVITENLDSRREAAVQAEEIVETQASHFMGRLRALDAVSTIRAYREGAEEIRDDMLERARQQLEQGKDPEEALEYLANVLTNKLLHTPSTQLTQAGYDGRSDFIEAARLLLGIDEPADKD